MAGRRSILLATLTALVGLVWIAQGLGAPIGRSFMVGDLRWTAAGLVLLTLGALYAWRGLHRS